MVLQRITRRRDATIDAFGITRQGRFQAYTANGETDTSAITPESIDALFGDEPFNGQSDALEIGKFQPYDELEIINRMTSLRTPNPAYILRLADSALSLAPVYGAVWEYGFWILVNNPEIPAHTYRNMGWQASGGDIPAGSPGWKMLLWDDEADADNLRYYVGPQSSITIPLNKHDLNYLKAIPALARVTIGRDTTLTTTPFLEWELRRDKITQDTQLQRSARRGARL